MSDRPKNGKKKLSGQEPELNATKAAIERELVFIELKEEASQRLELPTLVPILRQDYDQEMAVGQLTSAAFAAGIEALKLLQPSVTGYDRFLARYYLLEAERTMQEEPDEYQAQRYFQKAVDLEQAELSAEAAFYLAALVSPDDQEKAIHYYRLSIDLNPQAATPHFELGRLLRERRDLPGALEEFEAAYKLEPDNATLLSEVGDTHLMVDDLPKAQAAYRRAVELEPDVWTLPLKLGITEYNLEEYPLAIRDLRNALDLAPNELDEGSDQVLYVEGLYYLALAFRDSDRPDQARKLIRTVLQFDPTHEGALNFGL